MGRRCVQQVELEGVEYGQRDRVAVLVGKQLDLIQRAQHTTYNSVNNIQHATLRGAHNTHRGGRQPGPDAGCTTCNTQRTLQHGTYTGGGREGKQPGVDLEVAAVLRHAHHEDGRAGYLRRQPLHIPMAPQPVETQRHARGSTTGLDSRKRAGWAHIAPRT